VNIVTRTLEPHELEAASAIIQTAIQDSPYYNDWSKREEIALHSPTKLRTMLEADPEGVIGAFADDELAGVITSDVDAGLTWLSWIAVAAQSRGRGVAHALMRALETRARARGAHKIWCDSRVENIPSARMLEANGYRVAVTLQKHWYGLDFYLWEKALETL
jgi:ribosomal protein S18 acetylase RimI-like enzyme